MKHALLILLIVLSIVAPLYLTTSTPPVAKAQAQTITVAVDLAHGERDKYLDYIMGNITFVNWKVIDKEINESALSDVDVLILGQPMVNLTLQELMAVKNWLAQGNKVIWVASDSDYGSGPQSQTACNFLLSQIGAKLRIEYAAAYDHYFNARRFYRVLGFVAPDYIPLLNTTIIVDGVKKPVLYHGPAPLVWVDENGTAHDPVTETFPGLIRIVWTSPIAYLGDNKPPAPLKYNIVTDRNRAFVMLAAEFHNDTGNLIVVSGESPYGDYEPTWASEYYGIPLDGPKFVTNMIKWFAWLIETKPRAATDLEITPPPMLPATTYMFSYVAYVPLQDGTVNIYGLDLDHGGVIANITYMAEDLVVGKPRPGIDIPGFQAAIFELITDGANPWYGVIPLERATIIGVYNYATNITIVEAIGPLTTVYPGLDIFRVIVIEKNSPTFLIGYLLLNVGNETLNITVAPAWGGLESGFMVEINVDILDRTNDFYYAIFDDGTEYINLRYQHPWLDIMKHVRGVAVVDNQDLPNGYLVALGVPDLLVNQTYRLWIEDPAIRIEFGNITLAPGENVTYAVLGYAGPLDYNYIAATGSPELLKVYNVFTKLVKTETQTVTETETETVTQTQTTTVTTTETTTETQTVTETITNTTTVTTTKTTTETETVTHTTVSPSPTTTTVTQTDWTLTSIIAIILLIIGIAIGFAVKRT